jgi:flagella basal body P-ring formation protein FlgA
MKIKLYILIVSIIPAGIAAAQSQLIINLPAEATVESENLTLGQIAEVKGDEAIAAKVREIGIGRISVPGQKVTIERTVILGRLACSEIEAVRPELAGAEAVVVSRKATVIKAESFVESSLKFLKENANEKTFADWETVREPDDMVLPNQATNVELVPRLASRTAAGQAIVEVDVISEGHSLGTSQVTFEAQYKVQRAVTTAAVSAGRILNPENVKIETVVSNRPQSAEWSTPYGLAAVRNFAAGTVIGPGMAKAPKAQVLIERNQNVVIRIDRPGLTVTATGKTLQQGTLGEYIKVRNVDSQRVILAKVNEDGTVEPVF